jgi:hypothetical protein
LGGLRDNDIETRVDNQTKFDSKCALMVVSRARVMWGKAPFGRTLEMLHAGWFVLERSEALLGPGS